MESPEEHLKRAEAALQTSMWQLKFSADHFLAATEFDYAGKGFYASQKFSEAFHAYKKCGEQRDKNGDPFGAARAYEEASRVAHDKLGKQKEALACLAESIRRYRQSNKAEACLRLSQKKVDILQSSKASLQEVRSAFDESIQQHVDFEKTFAMNDLYERYVNYLVAQLLEGNGSVVDIYKVIDDHIKNQTALKNPAAKQILAKVILCLFFQGDLVRVQGFLDDGERLGRQAGPDMIGLAYDLVQCFEQGDVALLETVKQKQLFSFVYVEVSKLVRTLEIKNPGGGGDGGQKIDDGVPDLC